MGRAIAAVLPVRTKTALLIVANTSFFFALVVLGLYVRARFPMADEDPADWVLLCACLFPTACFFRLPYSESSFLLLAILSLYGIERRWPLVVVALVVGLATASRPVGVALLAPLALDVWRRRSGSRETCSGSRETSGLGSGSRETSGLGSGSRWAVPY